MATSGELKEIAQKGYSQSGLINVGFFRKYSALNGSKLIKDNIGVINIMNETNKVEQDLMKVGKAILSQSKALKEIANLHEEKIVESSRKIRDSNHKLTDAIDGFVKKATSAQFMKAVDDAERLAIALEKISDLESKGILNKLTQLMKG